MSKTECRIWYCFIVVWITIAILLVALGVFH